MFMSFFFLGHWLCITTDPMEQHSRWCFISTLAGCRVNFLGAERFKMRLFWYSKLWCLNISEASSEKRENFHSAWIWETCSLLVKLRKSYSVLGGKMNRAPVLILTEPDWSMTKAFKHYRNKWHVIKYLPLNWMAVYRLKCHNQIKKEIHIHIRKGFLKYIPYCNYFIILLNHKFCIKFLKFQIIAMFSGTLRRVTPSPILPLI